MNFSALAGCSLACRFSRLMALKNTGPTSKQYIYNSLLSGCYKKVIETQLPVDARIMYGDANGPFTFGYRGIKETVQAVAVINNEPHLVKVIIVNEPVIVQTLRTKFDSVYISLQALMKLSGQTGNGEIKKSLILAIDVSDYSVSQMILEADEFEQGSIKQKIDCVLASNDPNIVIHKDESKCDGCSFSPICNNETLPVVSCSTCAFFTDNELPECSLGNNVGVKCASHLYNPLLLVNHKHIKVDVQNLYVEYDEFINCNSDMGFKTSMTSDEMLASHKFNAGGVKDEFIESMKSEFNAKIVVKNVD